MSRSTATVTPICRNCGKRIEPDAARVSDPDSMYSSPAYLHAECAGLELANAREKAARDKARREAASEDLLTAVCGYLERHDMAFRGNCPLPPGQDRATWVCTCPLCQFARGVVVSIGKD